MPSVPVLFCHCQQVWIVLRRFSSLTTKTRKHVDGVPSLDVTWGFNIHTNIESAETNDEETRSLSDSNMHANVFSKNLKETLTSPQLTHLPSAEAEGQPELLTWPNHECLPLLWPDFLSVSVWVVGNGGRVCVCALLGTPASFACFCICFFSSRGFFLKHVWQARWASRLWRVCALLRLLHTFAPWWMTGSKKQYSFWHSVFTHSHFSS